MTAVSCPSCGATLQLTTTTIAHNNSHQAAADYTPQIRAILKFLADLKTAANQAAQEGDIDGPD